MQASSARTPVAPDRLPVYLDRERIDQVLSKARPEERDRAPRFMRRSTDR